MLRNPLVLALILLGGFIWLLRSPYGDQVRSFVMAEPVAVVEQGAVTPTQASAPAATAMATAAPESTPTATALPPTATRTLQPTMTPSPTKYVVTVDVITKRIENKQLLITQQGIFDVVEQNNNRESWQLWNAELVIFEYTYTVNAGVDLQRMQITVDKNNKITVKLPKTEIINVSSAVNVTPYKNGLKFVFEDKDAVNTQMRRDADRLSESKARERACQVGLLKKASREAELTIKDLILSIDSRIRSSDITIKTSEGTCSK